LIQQLSSKEEMQTGVRLSINLHSANKSRFACFRIITQRQREREREAVSVPSAALKAHTRPASSFIESAQGIGAA